MAVSRTWYAFSCRKTQLHRGDGERHGGEGANSAYPTGSCSFSCTQEFGHLPGTVGWAGLHLELT